MSREVPRGAPVSARCVYGWTFHVVSTSRCILLLARLCVSIAGCRAQDPVEGIERVQRRPGTDEALEGDPYPPLERSPPQSRCGSKPCSLTSARGCSLRSGTRVGILHRGPRAGFTGILVFVRPIGIETLHVAAPRSLLPLAMVGHSCKASNGRFVMRATSVSDRAWLSVLHVLVQGKTRRQAHHYASSGPRRTPCGLRDFLRECSWPACCVLRPPLLSAGNYFSLCSCAFPHLPHKVSITRAVTYCLFLPRTYPAGLFLLRQRDLGRDAKGDAAPGLGSQGGWSCRPRYYLETHL